MPPVFGPVSPSPIRLKSCAAPSGTTRVPSEIANSDTSLPLEQLLDHHATVELLNREQRVVELGGRAADEHALARCEPVGLDDARAAGRPRGSRRSGCPQRASRPWRMPSILRCAPPRPRARRPRSRFAAARRRCRRRAGLRPDHDEIGVERHCQVEQRRRASSARTGWQQPSAAIPGLPGAAWSSVRLGLRASRHASACSRAPEPTTTTCTAGVLRVYCGVPSSAILRRARPAVRDDEGRGPPGSRTASATRRGRSRGAARDPDRRPARRGDDAHARPRRGARARLRALRGPAARPAPGCPTTSPRTPSSSTRPASIPTGSRGASTRRARAASAARAPSRRSRSRRRGSRATSASPPRGSRRCPTACARRRPAFAATGGHPRDRPLRRRRRAALPPRGRGPPQRDGQGRRLGVRRGLPPARGRDPLRQRPALVRARAEGSRRRLPDARRGRRAVVARGRARPRSRRDALRLRPRRPAERLHRAVARRQSDGRPARRRSEHAGSARRRRSREIDGETFARPRAPGPRRRLRRGARRREARRRAPVRRARRRDRRRARRSPASSRGSAPRRTTSASSSRSTARG